MTQEIYNGVLASFQIPTDVIATLHYQQLKPVWGPAGTASAWDDSTPPPVRNPRVGTATVTQVGDSASSITLAAANANRFGLIVENLSSAILYLKYGSGASATSHTVRLETGAVWEMGYVVYTGVVAGLWASDAGGFAYVTEM